MDATTLTHELAREQLDFEIVRHQRTESANEEARELGLDRDNVGKTLVVTDDERFVRVVLPASRRLDLRKLREVLPGGKHLRLASEAELAGAYPMFELGAVPPVGGPPDDLVLDARIAARDSVVFEAGTHEESFRCKPRDLSGLAHVQVADISRPEEKEER